MSLFDQQIAGHYARLRSVRGLPATITRAGQSCSATVLVARTDREAVSTRNVTFVAGLQDLIVKADEYAPRFDEPLAEAITEPRAGDQIEFTQAGLRLTCEVRPRGSSQDVAIEIDSRQHWRVYTKIVNRERV